jgi:hypothetical protein
MLNHIHPKPRAKINILFRSRFAPVTRGHCRTISEQFLIFLFRLPLAFSDSLTDRSLTPHSPMNPSLTDPSLTGTPVPRSTAP